MFRFSDHIRALNASFAWRTPYYGNTADTYADRGLTPSPDAKAKGGRVQQASRGHRPRWPSRLNEPRSALISRAHFGYPDLVFPWFSWVVRQMQGYTMQSRGTARTPLPQARRLHLSAWKKLETSSLLTIVGTGELLLVGETVHTCWKHLAFREACTEFAHWANAVRMGSSNSSFAISFWCASFAFPAGIIFVSIDCTSPDQSIGSVLVTKLYMF